jgi:hypothetical protein
MCTRQQEQTSHYRGSRWSLRGRKSPTDSRTDTEDTLVAKLTNSNRGSRTDREAYNRALSLTNRRIAQGYSDVEITRAHLAPTNLAYAMIQSADDPAAASATLISRARSARRPRTILSKSQRQEAILAALRANRRSCTQNKLVVAVGAPNDRDTRDDLTALVAAGALRKATDRRGWHTYTLAVSIKRYHALCADIRRGVARMVAKTQATRVRVKAWSVGAYRLRRIEQLKRRIALHPVVVEEEWPAEPKLTPEQAWAKLMA